MLFLFGFSPNDVTRFQTAVAASNDVTQILVVPVETDLHFSSQNLAPFLVAWLIEHVFAALRCFCTHAHTSTFIFHTNTHRLIVETRSVCGSVGSFELQTTCNSGI